MISTRSVDHINRKVAGTELIIRNYSGIAETEAKTDANNYWKDRTSHARQSLHSDVEANRGQREFTLYLAHGMKYGRFLEEGTAPHVIRPKNKKALFWAGAAHPVKKVNHPGTKARPLLMDTLQGVIPRLERDILKWWEGENITVITGPSRGG